MFLTVYRDLPVPLVGEVKKACRNAIDKLLTEDFKSTEEFKKILEILS